ncbi:hypothetical protein FHT02_004079 [Sphingomonas xinjiangensis]|uniref:Uncharacterized protein n=1 Tax=Sphingomonas xinjiangensis TaxID=643568 RepID=A0A840YT18_9SPHN|nr:hypothetical protein [Sphingomonas xinjiangensis]
MSRYKLEPRADRNDVDHAIVGWDRPLETFFAQVFSTASPNEDPIVWVGADYGSYAPLKRRSLWWSRSRPYRWERAQNCFKIMRTGPQGHLVGRSKQPSRASARAHQG